MSAVGSQVKGPDPDVTARRNVMTREERQEERPIIRHSDMSNRATSQSYRNQVLPGPGQVRHLSILIMLRLS